MSLLDLSLLGMLADQPLHGYELSKRLGELGRGAVSYGALYPALGRLHRKGLITGVSTVSSGASTAPMTGSLGAEVARLANGGTASSPGRSRRRRKVYTVSPTGMERLHELLLEPAEDDRTFSTQLAFASHLTVTERLAMLEHRQRMLNVRLADDTAGFLDRYRRALHERDRLADGAEVEWLTHLIAAERDDAASPSPADESVDDSPRTVGGSIR